LLKVYLRLADFQHRYLLLQMLVVGVLLVLQEVFTAETIFIRG